MALVLTVTVAALVTGINPIHAIGTLIGGQRPASPPSPAPTDSAGRFVATVLADTEDSWRVKFQARSLTYLPPTLVLFSGQTQSGCGDVKASAGPFYCPADRKAYLDLGYLAEFEKRIGVRSQAAEAFFLSHEVGHHVQALLGTIHDGIAFAEGAPPGNQQPVRIELQADCFAGIWALSAKTEGMLNAVDISEMLKAAAAAGDDVLPGGPVAPALPPLLPHGTSEQRQRWFSKGYAGGEVAACDTFAADPL